MATTRTQVKEEVRVKFANEIRLQQLNEEKIVDFVQEQIVKGCQPACFSCFDKGYCVQETSLRETMLLFCHCDNGKVLKKVIEENYAT